MENLMYLGGPLAARHILAEQELNLDSGGLGRKYSRCEEMQFQR